MTISKKWPYAANDLNFNINNRSINHGREKRLIVDNRSESQKRLCARLEGISGAFTRNINFAVQALLGKNEKLEVLTDKDKSFILRLLNRG